MLARSAADRAAAQAGTDVSLATRQTLGQVPSGTCLPLCPASSAPVWRARGRGQAPKGARPRAWSGASVEPAAGNIAVPWVPCQAPCQVHEAERLHVHACTAQRCAGGRRPPQHGVEPAGGGCRRGVVGLAWGLAGRPSRQTRQRCCCASCHHSAPPAAASAAFAAACSRANPPTCPLPRPPSCAGGPHGGLRADRAAQQHAGGEPVCGGARAAQAADPGGPTGGAAGGGQRGRGRRFGAGSGGAAISAALLVQMLRTAAAAAWQR